MYKLNGYELDLDLNILEKYSELVSEDIESPVLNNSLSWMGIRLTKSKDFTEAINKVGIETLSTIIMKQIEEELSVFYVEGD